MNEQSQSPNPHLYERLRSAAKMLRSAERPDEAAVEALIGDIEELISDNVRLKQEAAKLRSAKAAAAKSPDRMSTKLKEALRE